MATNESRETRMATLNQMATTLATLHHRLAGLELLLAQRRREVR